MLQLLKRAALSWEPASPRKGGPASRGAGTAGPTEWSRELRSQGIVLVTRTQASTDKAPAFEKPTV